MGTPTASIEENRSLSGLNTLAIPATAAYCLRCANIEDLRHGLDFAKKHDLALMVLGEGSNTVFCQDYPGLVMLNRLRGIDVVERGSDQLEIKVAAGENWHDFVAYCLSQSWFGLENLALIPGLVGASPIQNIGAYGVEVKDFISSVEYMDIASGTLHKLSNSECQFDYRDSIFKGELADKSIVTSVNFILSATAKCVVTYSALAAEFSATPSPQELFKAVCRIRSNKLPSPESIPNAGSFFKNPIVTREHYQTLLREFPNLVAYEYGGDYKLAAAWLIEQRGWKNKDIDGVGVHDRQALVVVNPFHQTGDKVMSFAQAIQQDIYTAFSVELEIEPRQY